jgi:hypothetical protein
MFMMRSYFRSVRGRAGGLRLVQLVVGVDDVVGGDGDFGLVPSCQSSVTLLWSTTLCRERFHM